MARVRDGLPEWDGQRFELDDPRIPENIRKSVAKVASSLDSLYFCDTARGGEWWLVDDAGELIEVFWSKR